jgi:hypothetical protein
VNKSLSNDACLSDLALANVEALAQKETLFPVERCLTDQTRTTVRINCHASMIDAIFYDFTCKGSGDICYGTTGLLYDCLGNMRNLTQVISKPC